MSKSVFDQQGCRALNFALARLSCFILSVLPLLWRCEVCNLSTYMKSMLILPMQKELLHG